MKLETSATIGAVHNSDHWEIRKKVLDKLISSIAYILGFKTSFKGSRDKHAAPVVSHSNSSECWFCWITVHLERLSRIFEWHVYFRLKVYTLFHKHSYMLLENRWCQVVGWKLSWLAAKVRPLCSEEYGFENYESKSKLLLREKTEWMIANYMYIAKTRTSRRNVSSLVNV